MQFDASLSAALAPTGVLRVSINIGNPILAHALPASDGGSAAGVSVDLARGLAQSLGVTLALQVFDTAAKSVQSVTSGASDIGFFAIDPARAAGIHFTAPYVLIEGAYLVAQNSPISDNQAVDRPGIRVAVGSGSAYDLYLTRQLQQAVIVRAATSPSVVDTFLAQGLEVAAGVKQQLEADAQRLPGLRILPGRFMQIKQAMGLPSNRSPAALSALRSFVEAMKKSGFVAAALERHNIHGATVAPLEAD